MLSKKTIAIMLFALSLTACGGDKSTTKDSASTQVKDRQALMQDWRSAMDILKGMSDNPASFDSAVAKEQAKFLQDTAPTMWTHFSDGANKGKSKDEIWSDPEGFKKASEQFGATVANLYTISQTATQITDLEPAIGQVGEACGSCHKAFKH